jgi:hypothetical protein
MMTDYEAAQMVIQGGILLMLAFIGKDMNVVVRYIKHERAQAGEDDD